jgi:hypothetical protein
MADPAPETQPRETPPPAEPHIEDSISGQWAETNPLLWIMLMLVALVWSALRGRRRSQADPALRRHESSDEGS